MSGDLQTYQILKATTSSIKSEEDEPYISHADSLEAERLQALAGGGVGSVLLAEESNEFAETLGELGLFASDEIGMQQ